MGHGITLHEVTLRFVISVSSLENSLRIYLTNNWNPLISEQSPMILGRSTHTQKPTKGHA
jgi:hypothetical protein